MFKLIVLIGVGWPLIAGALILTRIWIDNHEMARVTYVSRIFPRWTSHRTNRG